jgi:hypothetical protein
MTDPAAGKIGEALHEAQNLIQRGRHDEARVLLTALQTYHPGNTEVQTMLAYLHQAHQPLPATRAESIWTREISGIKARNFGRRASGLVSLGVALFIGFPALHVTMTQVIGARIEKRGRSGQSYYVPVTTDLAIAGFLLALGVGMFVIAAVSDRRNPQST